VKVVLQILIKVHLDLVLIIIDLANACSLASYKRINNILLEEPLYIKHGRPLPTIDV
jgi:hypothetical protein